jgi:hypothetical protein
MKIQLFAFQKKLSKNLLRKCFSWIRKCYLRECRIHKLIHYRNFKKKKIYLMDWLRSVLKRKNENLKIRKFEKGFLLQRSFCLFQKNIYLSKQNDLQDLQHNLYCNLFVLVNKFRAWKDLFMSKWINMKLHAHRIMKNKLKYLFQSWFTLFVERKRTKELKVHYFLQERHGKYYCKLFSFQKLVKNCYKEKEIFYYFHLKKSFFQFYKKIYQIKLQKRHLLKAKRFSVNRNERKWFQKWQYSLIARKEKKIQYFNFLYHPLPNDLEESVYLTSANGTPVFPLLSLVNKQKNKNYFDLFHLKKCFSRFILSILRKRQIQLENYNKAKVIRKRKHYQVIYESFYVWKNNYFMSFLHRLNEKSNLLKYSNQSSSSSDEAEGERVTDDEIIHNSFSTSQQPLFLEAMTNELSKVDSKIAAITSILPKTEKVKGPKEFAMMKYFLVWKQFSRQTRRLKYIGKLIYKKQKVNLLSKYFQKMESMMIKTLYQKIKSTKQFNSQAQQNIES